MQDLPSEAPRTMSSDPSKYNWPKEGAIVFNEVKLKYRSDLPLVLHGICATVNAGEKIGIVGRTGAGRKL